MEFPPIYKLKSESATVSWVQAEDTDSGLVRDKDSLTHGTACRLSFMSLSVPPVPKSHGAMCRGSGGCYTYAILAERCELGEPTALRVSVFIFLGEVLSYSSRLPVGNTTLRNRLGKEQRAGRAWHSWHPTQLSGAQDPWWIASSNTKELMTMISQAVSAMHK